MKHFILILLMSFVLTGCFHSSNNNNQVATQTPPVEENTPEDVGQPPESEPTPEEPVEPQNFAELSWTAPFERENGDTLHLYEIDYFVITHFWGDQQEEVQVEYSVDTHMFTGLVAGVHEFQIRTVDIDGLQSQPSDKVHKTIN